MRPPGPAIGLEAQWTQGYLRNQDCWDEFVAPQCPDTGLIKWWRDMNMVECSKWANIIAGINWGRPASQKKIFMDDDIEQWKIYRRFLQVIEEELELLGEEIMWLKAWHGAGHSYFQNAAVR